MLTDSVIYVGKKPIAFYTKEANKTVPHYDITVYSLSKKLLMTVQVKTFPAPVKELKSFDYYEIIFAAVQDTFALYHEGEAFPVTFAEIIRDYQLIKNNQLDTAAIRRFKAGYNHALENKVDEMSTYLEETRHFNDQVERDRTKPVSVINNRKIMQDGKLIGYLSGEDVQAVADRNGTALFEITMPDGRKVEYDKKIYVGATLSETDLEKGIADNPLQQLYNISRNKKLPWYSEGEKYIGLLCRLIIDYDL